MFFFMGKFSVNFVFYLRGFLWLKCISYLVVRYERNMNYEFNNVINEVVVFGKVN